MSIKQKRNDENINSAKSILLNWDLRSQMAWDHKMIQLVIRMDVLLEIDVHNLENAKKTLISVVN